MTRGLDWKWIGIGVLIMVGLNLVAGLIVTMIWGGALQEAAAPGQPLALSGGQVALMSLIGFLTFVLGGYIVGVRSSGRTIVEPGISAAIAVFIGLLVSGTLTLGGIVAGGLIPFLAGLLGGWIGERRQGRV